MLSIHQYNVSILSVLEGVLQQLLIQLHVQQQQLREEQQQQLEEQQLPEELHQQLLRDTSKMNMIINIMTLTPTQSIEKIIIKRMIVIIMMMTMITCMEMKSLKTVTMLKRNPCMKTIL